MKVKARALRRLVYTDIGNGDWVARVAVDGFMAVGLRLLISIYPWL